MRCELLIKHPRLNVQLREGTEGPRHDPYSYRELHATTPTGTTVLHEGLGAWIKHNDKTVTPKIFKLPLAESVMIDSAKFARAVFEVLVGFTPMQLERIATRLNSRCRKCGCRDFENVRGYPGETFYQCTNCHHINGSSQNYSAIE